MNSIYTIFKSNISEEMKMNLKLALLCIGAVSAQFDYKQFSVKPPNAYVVSDMSLSDLMTMMTNCSTKQKHSGGFIPDRIYHEICDMYVAIMSDLMENTKNYVPL